jgi:small-conductance mechanosensitive channel
MCLLPIMLKRSFRSWLSGLPYKLHNPILIIVYLIVSIGILLIAVAVTGVTPSAELTALVIDTLKILFAIYLVFSVVQVFKSPGKGQR